MNQYSTGEAALRAAPRRIGQAAVLVLALGLWANAGLATALVSAVVAHRTDAAVRVVQDAVRGLLPPDIAAPTAVQNG